jgi:hypothetical protein
MLFAEHGSNEGTLDYKGHQQVQAQFVALQPLNRVEEVKVHDPLPQPRNEEAEGQVPLLKPDEAEGHVTLPKPAAKMTSEE